MATQRRERWSAGHRDPEPIPGSILARIQRAGQRADAQLRPSRPGHEYAFLVGALIDAATLERAESEARHCGVATHDILLAAGWISEADYAAALARRLGVALASWDAEFDFADAEPGTAPEMACRHA